MKKDPWFSVLKSEESNDFTGEWIWKDKRFGIYLEQDLTECGWWAIKTDGTHISGKFTDDPQMCIAIQNLLNTNIIQTRTEKYFPRYCCQNCGDLIGYLGKFFVFLFGKRFHRCKRSI